MLGWLQALRKELETIKKAPWSFAIVCAVAVTAIWSLVHYQYRSKLDDAHELTAHWMGESQHWQSDAEYWKDIASHTVIGTPNPSTPPNEGEPSKSAQPAKKDGKPTKTVGRSTTMAPEEPSSVNKPDQIVSAPNGIAVGGGTVSNPTVNNFGPRQRQLTPSQENLILSMID
ncbi:MAG: hypothetical protein WA185_11015 [Candidatus Acidiferrales bacterium]